MPNTMNVVMFTMTPEGLIKPDLFSNPELYIGTVQQLTADEVVGDGNANGTLILSVAVPVGRKLALLEASIYSKVAASTVVIVASDTNGVGGTETWLKVMDQNNAGMLYSNNAIVNAFIDNSLGTAPQYLLIYAPQTRAGLATNNANTQFWSASIKYIII